MACLESLVWKFKELSARALLLFSLTFTNTSKGKKWTTTNWQPILIAQEAWQELSCSSHEVCNKRVSRSSLFQKPTLGNYAASFAQVNDRWASLPQAFSMSSIDMCVPCELGTKYAECLNTVMSSVKCPPFRGVVGHPLKKGIGSLSWQCHF